MVFCDHCQRWYHFGCAGVSAEVRDISWSCEECLRRQNKERLPGLEEGIKKFEEELEKQRQAMEVEMILHRKKLEHQKKLFAMRQQFEKEKREMELAYEKEQMELQVAEEEAYRKKREEVLKEVQEKLEKSKLDPTKQQVGERDAADQNGAEGASGGENKKKKETKKTEKSKRTIPGIGKPDEEEPEKEKSGKSHREQTESANAVREDYRGAFKKYSTPKTSGIAPLPCQI